MLHCALIEPVKSLKPTVGQIYKYVGLEESFLHTLIDGYARRVKLSGNHNTLWLNLAPTVKTTLQLHFWLDSTQKLQKLFKADLPGL